MIGILIRTLLIYLLLSISFKIMGKRQLGELEISELVSTLLLSEVASLPIADPDIPLSNAIIPLFFILSLEIIISFFKNKSEKLKKAVEGKPIFLVFKGKLLQKNLKENRISVNELLSEMRVQGAFSLEDVEYVMLEQSGSLSVCKKNSQDSFSHPLIIDGIINSEMLDMLDYGKERLTEVLKEQNTKLEDVFLATINDENTLKIIRKER